MASFAITAASATPSAAANICQNPSSADAAPARSPNGERVCALQSGLTMPIPKRNTHAPQ
jgi:hypothetical protein